MIHQLHNYASEIPMEIWEPANPIKKFIWKLAKPLVKEYEVCLNRYCDYVKEMRRTIADLVADRLQLHPYLQGYENHPLYPSCVNHLVLALDLYSGLERTRVRKIVDVGGGIGLAGWAHTQVNPELESCLVVDPNPRLEEFLPQIQISNPKTSFTAAPPGEIDYTGAFVLLHSSCRCFSMEEVDAFASRMIRDEPLGVQFCDREQYAPVGRMLKALNESGWRETKTGTQWLHHFFRHANMFEKVFAK